MRAADGVHVAARAILAAIWLPLFSGVMQGRQDFFWYGWALIVGGVLRLAAAGILVAAFHAGATGMLGGALRSGFLGVCRRSEYRPRQQKAGGEQQKRGFHPISPNGGRWPPGAAPVPTDRAPRLAGY